MEGQTIALQVRWAEGRSEHMPALVAELLRLKVDVLVVGGTSAALSAKKSHRNHSNCHVGN
jgi:putative ABC transport system substrate-binding protein